MLQHQTFQYTAYCTSPREQVPDIHLATRFEGTCCRSYASFFETLPSRLLHAGRFQGLCAKALCKLNPMQLEPYGATMVHFRRASRLEYITGSLYLDDHLDTSSLGVSRKSDYSDLSTEETFCTPGSPSSSRAIAVSMGLGVSFVVVLLYRTFQVLVDAARLSVCCNSTSSSAT